MHRKGIPRLKRENLRLRAYDSIKRGIITLKLPPNSYINKGKIQKDFNLGVTPVREALLQLEVENLVTYELNKGFYVKSLDLHWIRDILENRLLMERYVAFLAVKRITEGELKELEKIISEMKCLAENAGEYDLVMKEREFHYLIVKSTRNSQLEKIMSLIYNECLRIWFISHLEEISKSVNLHGNIVKSLRQRDWDSLERDIIDHNTVFRKRIMGYLQDLVFLRAEGEETFKIDVSRDNR